MLYLFLLAIKSLLSFYTISFQNKKNPSSRLLQVNQWLIIIVINNCNCSVMAILVFSTICLFFQLPLIQRKARSDFPVSYSLVCLLYKEMNIQCVALFLPPPVYTEAVINWIFPKTDFPFLIISKTDFRFYMVLVGVTLNRIMLKYSANLFRKHFS